MKVISSEDIRVALTSGAVVLFAAGVEREVADEVGLIALQMGAKESKGSKASVAEEPAAVEAEAEAEEEVDTADDLVAIMEQLIADGDPKSFKADGSPKVNVVNKAAGRTVSTSEREAAWQEALNS
ncbi:MAG: hypothetical protein CMO61_13860 [Verrucomicrobiales bacterium]|nr:hypothetical protein [Verrucomicrobiales bacterium]